MLAEMGTGDSTAKLTEQALKCGATINHLGRLCFPPGLVEDIIDGACKSFFPTVAIPNIPSKSVVTASTLALAWRR